MLKNLMLALMALTTLAFSSASFAEEGKVTSLLYNCNLSFTAHGKSIYIGLGYTHLEGKGTLSCYDLLTGASEHINLKVNAVGPGAGLGATGLNVSGSAIGVKISRGPESLLGRYVAARVNAAVGIGVGASVPIRFSKDDVSVNVEVEGQSGLGAGVDLLAIDIEADGNKVIDSAVPRQQERPSAPPAQAYTQSVSTQNQESATVVYVNENQAIDIVDTHGRLLKTIYVKTK